MDGDPIVIPVPTTDPELGSDWGVLIVDLERLHRMADEAITAARELPGEHEQIDAHSWLMGAAYAALWLFGERGLSPASQIAVYREAGVAR